MLKIFNKCISVGSVNSSAGVDRNSSFMMHCYWVCLPVLVAEKYVIPCG